MNEMRKLINLTENVYADEASEHIEGLAEVMANYIVSVSDDPYLYSDISEFLGGTLEARVTELIQAKRKGLGEDRQYRRDQGEKHSQPDGDEFVSGYHVGHEDCQNGQNDVYTALDAWRRSNRY